MHTHRFVGVAAAMLLAVSAIAVTDADAQTGRAIVVPIAGTGAGSTFTGVLEIQRFVRSGTQIVGIGKVSGVLTNTATGISRNVIRQLTVPLDTGMSGAEDGICQILSLVLGPLDLNLLGLLVHLDRVVLTIDAQSGPGNLLGNLLCVVAGLLDAVGLEQFVADLLNRILGILG
jgi:hypothetical protein